MKSEELPMQLCIGIRLGRRGIGGSIGSRSSRRVRGSIGRLFLGSSIGDRLIGGEGLGDGSQGLGALLQGVTQEEEDRNIQDCFKHQQDADDQVAVLAEEGGIQQGDNADDQGEGSKDEHNPPFLYLDGFLIESILDLQESAKEEGKAPDEGENVFQIIRIESQERAGNQQDQAGGKTGFGNAPDGIRTKINNAGPDAAENHDPGQYISRDPQGEIAEEDQQQTADQAEKNRQDHGTGSQCIGIFFTTTEKLEILHNRYSSAFIFISYHKLFPQKAGKILPGESAALPRIHAFGRVNIFAARGSGREEMSGRFCKSQRD